MQIGFIGSSFFCQLQKSTQIKLPLDERQQRNGTNFLPYRGLCRNDESIPSICSSIEVSPKLAGLLYSKHGKIRL